MKATLAKRCRRVTGFVTAVQESLATRRLGVRRSRFCWGWWD
jgi:hypothetical protein